MAVLDSVEGKVCADETDPYSCRICVKPLAFCMNYNVRSVWLAVTGRLLSRSKPRSARLALANCSAPGTSPTHRARCDHLIR